SSTCGPVLLSQPPICAPLLPSLAPPRSLPPALGTSIRAPLHRSSCSCPPHLSLPPPAPGHPIRAPFHPRTCYRIRLLTPASGPKRILTYSHSLNSCASFNPFPAATMSNNMAKIAEARKTVEQLKLEVNIDRMKVSQAAAELLAFCETHAKDDPLVTPVPAAENPFRDKRLFCVLL
uniref:Guanine nucleotide-binding protein subunit gamma n=1 Tax=Macaca fascicularis TaxID=9541 RepID=A0A7N9CZX2_MACFA